MTWRSTPLRLRVQPPLLSVTSVPRSRLLDGPIWQVSVVLVTSPAGSGKTTVLAQRAALLKALGQPVAWLVVEHPDDRREPIWSGLAWSISKALANGGQPEWAEAVGALRLMDPVDHHGVATALADLLSAAPRPLTVILDDAHHLAAGPEAESLLGLIATTVPAVSFVLSGRWDPPFPMSTLKLQGLHAELRATDLAFTPEDTAALLARHGFEVDDVEVKTLVDRTEGLAAGLQLAAMAMSRLPTAELRSEYVATFAGDLRPVAEFLVSEVLDGLDPATRALMTATAVPAQVTVGLATELTGRSDAGAVLEQLAEANALVFKLDGPDPAYRYHVLLRSYLNADGARSHLPRQRELRRTTAAWAERHGLVEDAISHSTQAEDWPSVCRMLAEHGLTLLLRGRGAAVRTAMDVLPPASRRSTDMVELGVVMAALTGDRGALADALSRAHVSGAERNSSRRRALLRVGRIADALLSGDRSVLPEIGSSDGAGRLDVATRALLIAAEGRYAAFHYDYELCERHMAEAYALATEQGFELLALECLSFLVVASAGRGQIGELHRRTLEAMDFARKRGWTTSPLMAATYGSGAWGAWISLDDDLVGEFVALTEGMQGATQPQATAASRLHRALLDYGQTHDHAVLRRVTREVWERIELSVVAPPAYIVYATTELGVATAAGQREWTREIFDRAEQILSPDALGHLRHGCDLATLRLGGRVHIDESPAPETFTPAYAWTWSSLVEVGALARREQHVQAHDKLRTVLQVAAPLGLRRPFLDAPQSTRRHLQANADRLVEWQAFLDPVLTTIKADTTGASSSTLTTREQQLLAELGSRLTYREIGDVLGISENTVRTHLKNLYRKLGVSSRREALAKTGHLGLNSPHPPVRK